MSIIEKFVIKINPDAAPEMLDALIEICLNYGKPERFIDIEKLITIIENNTLKSWEEIKEQK